MLLNIFGNLEWSSYYRAVEHRDFSLTVLDGETFGVKYTGADLSAAIKAL